MLCAPDEGPVAERLVRPQKGLYRLEWFDDDPAVEFHPSVSEMFALLRENGFELLDFRELFAPEDAVDHEYYDTVPAEWAKRWPDEEIWRRAPARVSVPPAPPLLLASRSPQRRAILEQLGVPFEVALPQFEEAVGGADPAETVRENARGKARSVAGVAAERPVLGVDTEVVVEGRVFGKPGERLRGRGDAGGARRPDARGRLGLCLLTPGWEEVEHEVTRVSFRELDARDLAAYVGTGEWEGRAGAYAVQGRGAALVERIEGDYLNVVGLPAALLVRLLAERFPGVYGFG